MKTSVTVLVVLLMVTGGVLAVMNNACKTSHHSWCAPGRRFGDPARQEWC